MPLALGGVYALIYRYSLGIFLLAALIMGIALKQADKRVLERELGLKQTYGGLTDITLLSGAFLEYGERPFITFNQPLGFNPMFSRYYHLDRFVSGGKVGLEGFVARYFSQFKEPFYLFIGKDLHIGLAPCKEIGVLYNSKLLLCGGKGFNKASLKSLQTRDKLDRSKR